MWSIGCSFEKSRCRQKNLAVDCDLQRLIPHNGQQGWLETFGPHAVPEEGWLVGAEEKLAKIRG